eukprot:73393-Prymnesium_polylepis.1
MATRWRLPRVINFLPKLAKLDVNLTLVGGRKAAKNGATPGLVLPPRGRGQRRGCRWRLTASDRHSSMRGSNCSHSCVACSQAFVRT